MIILSLDVGLKQMVLNQKLEKEDKNVLNKWKKIYCWLGKIKFYMWFLVDVNEPCFLKKL